MGRECKLGQKQQWQAGEVRLYSLSPIECYYILWCQWC